MNAGTCPVNRCTRTLRGGMLMCGPHWHQVPAPLQTDVWETWRTWEVNFGDHPAAQAYRSAKTAAIAWIDSHLPQLVPGRHLVDCPSQQSTLELAGGVALLAVTPCTGCLPAGDQ